jgi:heterodisulfide reductase subunit C2
MTMTQENKVKYESLASRIKAETGSGVEMCYQCGKCSGGCPLADEMDYAPNQILRMLQYETPEMDETVLRSYSIWLCLTCETCYTRCPKEVDLPKITEFIREESLNRNMTSPKAKCIIDFHKSFLSSVKNMGRLYEVGLVSEYKARTMHLFQDLDVAPKMFLKGKLNLFPHTIKGRDEVKRIFERTMKKKEEK